MIRIIKEGRKVHETTCKKCGCIFEFEAEDVTEQIIWDDHGGHYPAASFYEINCPCCSETIDIGKITELMKEKEKMICVDWMNNERSEENDSL